MQTAGCKLPLAASLGTLAIFIGVSLWGSPFLWRFTTEVLLVGCAVMSLNLLIGRGGLVSLGHGAIFGFAGYAAAIASQSLGANVFLVLLIGVASGMALAGLMALLTLRSNGLFFLVATLIAGQLVWEVAFRWRDLTGGADGMRGFPRLSLGEWSLGQPLPLMLLGAAVTLLSWLTLRGFMQAPVGIALSGLRDQPLRMAALGYQAWRLRLYAFLVSGAVAGAAGSLYPFANQYASPQQVHWSFSASLIIMGVIGGIRTLLGGLVGAAVYLFIQTYLSSYTERWQLLIGLVFVATVVFLPRGLAQLWPERRT